MENGMIKIKFNRTEKRLFSSDNPSSLAEVAINLTKLPTDALIKMAKYLKDGNYNMFISSDNCNYTFTIDLDNLKVNGEQFERVETTTDETHSLIIAWHGYFKGIFALPLDKEQMEELKNIIISQDVTFARNIFNGISQDYFPMPDKEPGDWVVIDTDEYEHKSKKNK